MGPQRDFERRPSLLNFDVHCGILVADGVATFGLLPDVDLARKAESPTS
jgi:hypothetical protein